MRLTSKRFSAILSVGALCLSCQAGPAEPKVGGVQPGSALARRAPGVAETIAVALPKPARSGNSRDQLLLLRAPPVVEAAQRTVRDFLRAIVAQAPERFALLLTSQAYVNTPAGRQPALSFWQTRIAQFDYGALNGQLLFREADLQAFRAQDLARLAPNRRLPLELGEDEVAMRVPIRISWAGRTRLFGDELIFRLQPVGDRFEIAEISEDFRAP
jgi:hypothetical protein